MKKVWLIQPGIAPYRIPLFEELANVPGIDLTVVLACRQVPGQPWEIPWQEMRFKTLLVSGFNWNIGHERQVQVAFPLLWRLLRARPDLVVCSGFTFPTLFVMLAKWFTGTPFVIWNEGTEYTDGNLSGAKAFLRRRMARSADAFIVAGSLSRKYTESLLKEQAPEKFSLSYNCVNNAHFMKDENDPRIKSECELLRQRLPRRNILHVGRLIPLKGIKQLMEAYKDLVQKPGTDDVGLILLGQGHLDEYIRDYAAKNKLRHVFVEGFVQQETINAYYMFADVFVLLSLYDANPLVIFEALASGIPIVCSYRAGNAVDFVREGQNGFVVDPMNKDQVVGRLLTTLTALDRDVAGSVSKQLVEEATYGKAVKGFLDAFRHTGAIAK